MLNEEYTYLILDDGPDGFIALDGKGIIHTSIRYCTKFLDSEIELSEIEKHKRRVPGAKIRRVRMIVEDL